MLSLTDSKKFCKLSLYLGKLGRKMNNYKISSFFNDDFVKKLNIFFSNNENVVLSTEDDAVINICPNKFLEDPPETHSFRCFIKSGENLVEETGNELIICINLLVVQYNKQKECQHKFTPYIYNPEKDEHPDGHGECQICGFIKGGVFNKTLLRRVSGDFNDNRYLAKQKWPEKCFLQCGGSGIVLNKKENYQTAFFEAFPTIEKYKTFIRGEGKDIYFAELDAWNKYEKKLKCKEHQFERKGRVDGHGTCKKCNLSTSDALSPLTTCKVCNRITKNKIFDDCICPDDVIKMGAKRYAELHHEYFLENSRHSSFTAGAIFNNTIKYHLIKSYFSFVDYDIAKYDSNSYFLDQLAFNIGGYIRNRVFGMSTTLISKEYPSVDDTKFIECINYMEEHVAELFLNYEKTNKILIKKVIDEKYWKK